MTWILRMSVITVCGRTVVGVGNRGEVGMYWASLTFLDAFLGWMLVFSSDVLDDWEGLYLPEVWCWEWRS